MVAYDSANVPIDGAAILYVIFFAVLLVGCFLWRRSGRRLRWYYPAAIILGGLYFGGVPLWDEFRVSRMDRGQMQSTRGTISKLWNIRTRQRTTEPFSPLKRETRVTEGFDIGEDSFSWTASRCISIATLCRRADSKVQLREGLNVEVTWFADPLLFGRRRIVRLVVVPDARPSEVAQEG